MLNFYHLYEKGQREWLNERSKFVIIVLCKIKKKSFQKSNAITIETVQLVFD